MDNILEALLNTMPTADGRDDEFEELWDRILTTRQKSAAQPLGPITPSSNTTASGPPPSTAVSVSATTSRVPRVGTLIQRSTATNARKLQALLEVPPPPPRRVRGTIRSRPTAPCHAARSEEARKTPNFLASRSPI